MPGRRMLRGAAMCRTGAKDSPWYQAEASANSLAYNQDLAISATIVSRTREKHTVRLLDAADRSIP